MVKLWIDAGAAFPGTYTALGGGMLGSYAALQSTYMTPTTVTGNPYGTNPRPIAARKLPAGIMNGRVAQGC